jgi:death-on-curing protein
VTDPDFLSVEDVLTLHEEQLKRFGGVEGLRDLAALESAVAQPAATFGGGFLHGDLFEMAAAYAFHIAQNQHQAMIDIAEHRIDKHGLAVLLRDLVLDWR